jgi:tetratricopeptide (TPR) repeat protein
MVNTKKSVKEYLKLGNNLLLEGKYEEAETAYQQAIALQPDHAWINCNLGRSLLNQGKIEGAIPYLQKAIELDGNIAEAYYNLGNAFTKQNRFEEAVNAYRQAIELEPDQFLYYHQLGDCLLLQGKYEEAVSPYRKAIELNAEYAWSYHNLGKVLSELGKWEEAIAVYQKAVELWPENSDFHYGLGHAQVKLGKAEAGIVEYRRAIELRPQYISTSESQTKRQKPRDKLQQFLQLIQKRILVISRRAERIFSSQTNTELKQSFAKENYHVEFCSDVTAIDVSRFDAVLLLVHLHDEITIIKRLKEQGFSGLIIGWFWDNHHHYYENIEVINWVDICIPAHGFSTDLLQSEASILDEVAVPVCTTQWTREQAQKLFKQYGHLERSNSLYGGFTRYNFAAQRNRLIEQVQKAIPDNRVALFDQEHEDIYFGLSPEERFAQWCGYKVSLCLPLDKDLSQRFFDALLCGQIPMVPANILDLDSVIPAYTKAKLPIILIQDNELESIKNTYKKAIKIFDSEGINGVKERHQFVLDNHLLIHRIKFILERLNNVLFFELANRTEAILSYPSTIDSTFPHIEFEKGEIYSLRTEWEKAAVHYSNASQLEPQSSWYRCCLGIALTQQNKLTEAVTVYRQAIESDTHNAWLYKCLAEALFQQKQYAEAVNAYEQALNINSNDFWYCDNLGHALFYLGRWEEAVKAYYRAIEIHRYDAELHIKRIQCLFEQEKWEEAESNCRYGIEVLPENAELYQLLVTALIQQGKTDEAKVYDQRCKLYQEIYRLRQLINTNPSNFQAQSNLGAALASLEKWDQAAASYSKAIQLDASHSQLFIDYGKTLAQQGKWDEAVVAYCHAVQLSPNNPSLHNILGEALSKTGKWQEMVAVYQNAIQLAPQNWWFYFNLGLALSKQEKWDEAVVVYSQAQTFNPDGYWAYSYYGQAFSKTQKWKEATYFYQQAIEQNYCSDYDALGDALFQQGKWDEAIDAYRRTFEQHHPHISWSHKLSFVGWSYHEKAKHLMQEQQWQEAEVAYRNAIELNSNLPWHCQGMAQALEKQSRWQEAMIAYSQASILSQGSVWFQQNPDNVLQQMSGWGLVVCIYTCAKNIKEQQAIRATWLKELIKRKIPYFFVMGKPSAKTHLEGDILYVDAPDSYEHLPRKTYKLIQYIHDCTFYSHLMKVDDDCYVSIENVLNCGFEKYNYMGVVTTQLDKRWHFGKTNDSTLGEYQGEFKGNWANGACGYFLNRYAMEKFLEFADEQEVASELYEDKLVGDTLRKSKIEPIHAYHYKVGVERCDAYTNNKLGFIPGHETPYPHYSNDVAVFHSDSSPESLYKIHQSFYNKEYINRKFLTSIHHEHICLEKIDEREVNLAMNDILCFIVVRNESLRLPYLLSYYRKKGVNRFFVVDNHSTDGTLSYLLQQPDVHVWHTPRSYAQSKWGVHWIEVLLQNYGVHHWCVLVDADELLYYPDCETKNLHQLCQELDQQNQQAMMTTLLDMYSKAPLKDANYSVGQDFLEVCAYFDKRFYTAKALQGGPEKNTTAYFGGLRQRIFGGDPNSFCLNKAPLVKYDFPVRLYEGFHWIGGVNMAAQTGCLLHFKYFSTFHQYAEQEAKRGEHWNGASEYIKYFRKLEENPNLSFWNEQYSVKLEGSDHLVELGIIK